MILKEIANIIKIIVKLITRRKKKKSIIKVNKIKEDPLIVRRLEEIYQFKNNKVKISK